MIKACNPRIVPHAVLVSLLLFLSTVAGSVPFSNRSRADSAGSLPSRSCPYKSAAEWQNFLEKASDNPKWLTTCEDSTCDKDYYTYVKNKIQARFDQCAEFIAHTPALELCTKNMRTFVPNWLKQHDEVSYGFIMDNPHYLAEQETPDKPAGMMSPPQEIIKALPDRRRVELTARQNGWPYLTHDSALSGYRTFVVVSDPKGRFDQWMLLNLKKGDDEVASGTPFSVLTVQKKTAQGEDLPQTRIHFRDYLIEANKAEKQLPSGIKHSYHLELNQNGNGKCYSCHASGMRQLIARRTPILEGLPVRGEAAYSEDPEAPAPADFAYKRLIELNKRIRSYGPPDWAGVVRPNDHGPALGAGQGCLDCHNGSTRGILTVTTSETQISQKILAELGMPPDSELRNLLERREMKNPELSSEEHNRLKVALKDHRQILAEFYKSRLPTLRDWFLEKRCQ